MLINDRLSTILPTVGAFRRRSMQVKWLQRSHIVIEQQDQASADKTGATWLLNIVRAYSVAESVQISRRYQIYLKCSANSGTDYIWQRTALLLQKCSWFHHHVGFGWFETESIPTLTE